ncbi:hypothetical protein PHYBLDRAFT_187019, partial [Phycomyces blakesleeanus NRRL 1555(-)]
MRGYAKPANHQQGPFDNDSNIDKLASDTNLMSSSVSSELISEVHPFRYSKNYMLSLYNSSLPVDLDADSTLIFSQSQPPLLFEKPSKVELELLKGSVHWEESLPRTVLQKEIHHHKESSPGGDTARLLFGSGKLAKTFTETPEKDILLSKNIYPDTKTTGDLYETEAEEPLWKEDFVTSSKIIGATEMPPVAPSAQGETSL